MIVSAGNSIIVAAVVAALAAAAVTSKGTRWRAARPKDGLAQATKVATVRHHRSFYYRHTKIPDGRL